MIDFRLSRSGITLLLLIALINGAFYLYYTSESDLQVHPIDDEPIPNPTTHHEPPPTKSEKPPAEAHMDIPILKSSSVPIGIAAVKPDMLERLLSSLIDGHRGDETRSGNQLRELITVFKNNPSKEIDTVAAKWGVRVISAPDKLHTNFKTLEWKVKNQYMSQLYLFVLRSLFEMHPQVENVILLEEDLTVASDFHEFFEQVTPVMQLDPTVFCVSGWYDDSYPALVGDPSLVVRQDHFGGLGWATSRKAFYSILPEWIQRFKDPCDMPWDVWLQSKFSPRKCLAPLVARTHHENLAGVHYGSAQQKNLFSNMALNDVHDVKIDVDRLLQPNYDEMLGNWVREGIFIECKHDPFKYDNKTLIFYTDSSPDMWNLIMRAYGMYGIGLGGVARGLTRNIVIFRYANNWILIVASKSPIVEQNKKVFEGRSPMTSAFSTSKFQNCQLEVKPPPEMNVVMGMVDESCDEACARQSSVCEVQWLVYLNFCPPLNSLPNVHCQSCKTENLEFFHPSMTGNGTVCYTANPRHLNCAYKHPFHQRFCPCRFDPRLPRVSTETAPLNTIWPAPSEEKQQKAIVDIQYNQLDLHFSPSIPEQMKNLIKDFQSRLTSKFAKQPLNETQCQTAKAIKRVEVHINSVNEKEYPHGDNEAYHLEITSKGVIIISNTVYGTYHALTTMSQLLTTNQQDTCQKIHLADIRDTPRFEYRGLMIDTSHTYFPTNFVKKIIDNMSMLKMNVLHWHLTGDQSFSFESLKFPELHKKGAKENFYTQKELRDLVQYGKSQGVRIIPEISMPGNAQSWSKGYPRLTANCPKENEESDSLPLDISNEFTYEVIGELIGELIAIFDDPFFHIGGIDPLDSCWQEDQEFLSRMSNENMKNPTQWRTYFFENLFKIVSKHNKVLVLWDDSIEFFQSAVNNSSVISMWRGKNKKEESIKNGVKTIQANGYFLDTSPNGCSKWQGCYETDPRNGLSPKEEEFVIGGEAVGWNLDNSNEGTNRFDTNVWKKVAALSERLWSPKTVRDVQKAEIKLNGIIRLLE